MNKPQLRLPIDDCAVPGPEAPVWRPIHYLGSKLRIVEAIRAAVDRVNPTRRTVCDLFAGSGTVAAAFSKSRDVIAADIQEYSRVLCSAVLNPPSITDQAAQRFIGRAFGADHQTRLRAASPVIEYERECLDLALGVEDADRAAKILFGARGKRLTYRRTGAAIS